MSSPQSDYSYLYAPSSAPRTAANYALTFSEPQYQADGSWITATEIEDDDLMFGGKPLSAWYEEERQNLHTSSGSSSSSSSNGAGGSGGSSSGGSKDGSRHVSEDERGEEEARGRQRVRASYRGGKKSHKKS